MRPHVQRLSFVKRQQRLWPVVCLMLLLACSGSSVAQEDATADVHIIPRHVEQERSVSTEPTTEPPTGLGARPFFRKTADLVLIPVTVADSDDHLVTGLVKNDFQVFEGGVMQTITHFSSEDVPISLGVLFDTSGSMAPKMEKARKAIAEFFKTSNPLDEMCVITFAYKTRLLQDFTSNIGLIEKHLATIPATGRTTLLDAIFDALPYIKKGRHQRKALLIISDGGDNYSRHTEFDIRDLVQESEVQVYAIAITGNAKTEEEHFGPQLLTDITSAGGGSTFPVDDVNQLPRIAERIALELRNQYVLGYKPTTPPQDDQWHEVQVTVSPSALSKPFHVYAKTGYYSRAER